jgi:S-methylmethionine-dependent homocysteine/selenocysteine methylase
MNEPRRTSGSQISAPVEVLDGGTGTELEARGVVMDTHAWSAPANLIAPDLVRAVHEDYVRAGADILITNTYAAARPPLTAAGLAGEVATVNRNAVRAARAAREVGGGRRVRIAGSLSHVQMGHSPYEWPTSETGLRDIYREQAMLLAEGGVEVLVLEMVTSLKWALPALEAALETGLPVWIGFSFARSETSGELAPRGGDPSTLGELVSSLATPEVAALFVMHTEVEDVPEALEIVFWASSLPVGVYPNVGRFESPNWVLGGMLPEELALAARSWLLHGVSMIGGCCGTTPSHVRALTELARSWQGGLSHSGVEVESNSPGIPLSSRIKSA